jgi:ankyrin repeat protein
MSRALTPRSTLDGLRKEAKRWLKALRAGDGQARQRLITATGAAPADPTLRGVQLALAREYGFASWSALRQALDDISLARRSQAEHADIVLRSAAWDGDARAAARVLTRWPEIGGFSLYTAVVTGNLAEVERRLADDPTAASRPGGPLNWEPLLYLCYARIPGNAAHAPEIVRALLDRGADPNTRTLDAWDNPFTALTGVIGEGEGDREPHPQAAELATLLIEAGASPFDTQALYNTSIRRDDPTWLDFLWKHSEHRGQLDRWRAISRIGGQIPLNALDYLLGNAVAYNHVNRARWLLSHGADPNGLHAYSKRPLREEALMYGHIAIADLLVEHGAKAAPIDAHSAFRAACMRLDRDTARSLAQQHPLYLRDAWPMLTAARAKRADIVALLLELGMHVDVADPTQQRGLHNAAASGAVEVAKLLIAHGADIDRPTTHYGGPLGFAAHFQQAGMAALLAPLSRDVANLTYLSMKDRLRELFAQDPALVNQLHPRLRCTPLFTLPDDEDQAADMAAFLLEHGADPQVRNPEGLTPEQAARRRGLTDAADLMRAAEDS